MAEAFREAISGPHFTVTVSNLPPGKYVARLGMVETVYTNAGQRVFDITCGQQTLASNLDLLVAAGGLAKVYFVTGQVEQTGDTIGSLTFDFLGQTNDAELNTFELEDAAGTSLVSMRAADLLEVDGVAALLAPVIARAALLEGSLLAPEHPGQRSHPPDVAGGKSAAIAQWRAGHSATRRSGL